MKSIQVVAEAWSAYLGQKITPSDVAVLIGIARPAQKEGTK